MKTREIKELTTTELQEQMDAKREELNRLVLNHAISPIDNPAQIRDIRRTIARMVNGMLEELNITVPVALHLDHGSYEAAKECIEKGFSSVMFDGSKYGIEENIEKTKEIVALAHSFGSGASDVGWACRLRTGSEQGGQLDASCLQDRHGRAFDSASGDDSRLSYLWYDTSEPVLLGQRPGRAPHYASRPCLGRPDGHVVPLSARIENLRQDSS